MRLRSLDLDRFGHFAGKRFDFGPPGEAPDFHIVHGPNEAGKTTTMEAFLRLLYGFAHREPYGFRHQRKNLSVTATLDLGGTERRLTRLPHKTGALVDDTGAALPEQALAAHLGGLDETQYRQLLCLDDETIERGGEEILRSQGEIGRLLFAAAAGIGDLTPALDQIRGEADALYRPRASTTEMARIKAELKEVEAAIREQDLTAHAWGGLRRTLAAASAAADAAAQALAQAQDEEAALRAQASALPLLAELDALAPRLAAARDLGAAQVV